MNSFFSFSRLISATFDAFAMQTGKYLSWLALIMAISVTAIVVVRKLFGISFGAAQESIIYMHAFLIMLASAYTLLIGGHVRVDIFYRKMTSAHKAWVDAIGSVIFLLPTALAICLLSWEFVLGSWREMEGSSGADGIPAVFLLKTLLLLNGLSLVLQAISECLKATLILISDNEVNSDA